MNKKDNICYEIHSKTYHNRAILLGCIAFGLPLNKINFFKLMYIYRYLLGHASYVDALRAKFTFIPHNFN